MSKEYNEYLASPEWKTRRRMKLLEAGERCQLCNASDEPLHVHHRTYERRGDEHPMDLTVLCAECHAKHHDQAQRAVSVVIDGVTFSPVALARAVPVAFEPAVCSADFDGLLMHIKRTNPPLFHIVRGARFSVDGCKLTALLPNVPFVVGESRNAARVASFTKACKEFYDDITEVEMKVDIPDA